LGAVAALFHDAVIILGTYSLLHKYMPFNMEINQDFIAAILTVLGYSINDTVIIFDRIREYLREKKSLTLAGLFDDSISSTLGRTFNTSFTTILVILAIFIFGGDNLRGFMFAMLIGIGFGTYSSIFIASAIAYDFLKKEKKKYTENLLQTKYLLQNNYTTINKKKAFQFRLFLLKMFRLEINTLNFEYIINFLLLIPLLLI
jgi:SecD/SecF fusion protein